MPSPYDILGTVFGVLSLLGCIRCAYGFLKARQPFAQVVRLEELLWATYQRIDELERYGYLEGNPTLAAVYRSALKRCVLEHTRPQILRSFSDTEFVFGPLGLTKRAQPCDGMR